MAAPTLTLIGLDSAENSLFQTVVDLAGGVELHQWKIAQQPENTDVIIINSDVPRYLRDLNQPNKEGELQPLIVKLAKKPADSNDAINLLRPVTYASLVKLLKQLQERLDEQKNPAIVHKSSNPVPVTKTPKPPKPPKTPKTPKTTTAEHKDPAVTKPDAAQENLETAIEKKTGIPEEKAATQEQKSLETEEVSKNTEPVAETNAEEKPEMPEILSASSAAANEPATDEKITIKVGPESSSSDPGSIDSNEAQPDGVQADSQNLVNEDAGDESPAIVVGDVFESLELELEPDNSSEPATDELIMSTVFEIPIDLLESDEPTPEEKLADPTETTDPGSSELWLDKLLNSTVNVPQSDVEKPPPVHQSNRKEPAINLDEIIRPAKRFYPEMRLLGLLDSIIESETNCRISHQKFPDIDVFPVTDWYTSSINLNKTELFVTPVSEFEIEELGRQRIEKPVDDASAHDLWTLLYSAALFGSEGRLLQGCDAHAPIQLRETPDFSSIPFSDDHQRIATHLHDYPANLSQLATATQTNIKTVIDFTNACRKAGLVVQKMTSTAEETSANLSHQQASSSTPESGAEQKGLLPRIRSRLFGFSSRKRLKDKDRHER